MQLAVKRLGERKYETRITRSDGVVFHVLGVGHMFEIPHDLAHYAIEKALGLRYGFWGSVADGAVFPTMTYVSGRKRPKAEETSRAVLKKNAAHLTEAESLVRIFDAAMEKGLSLHELKMRLNQRWAPPELPKREFGEDDISKVRAAWLDVQAQWKHLPIGEELTVIWPD
jgi:hypothetical protein